MSFGRALRKIPIRPSRFWYQTGRMIASRSEAIRSISTPKPTRASSRPDRMPADASPKASRPRTTDGSTQTSDS